MKSGTLDSLTGQAVICVDVIVICGYGPLLRVMPYLYSPADYGSVQTTVPAYSILILHFRLCGKKSVTHKLEKISAIFIWNTWPP